MLGVQKTQNNFSCMLIDQENKQNSDLVKGYGGAIGLTEYPVAFKKIDVSRSKAGKTTNRI